MSNAHPGIPSGQFAIQAQERVVFGTPAGAAVLAEAEKAGAQRVFVTATRSLAKLADGPLQWVEKALGARHVGTFSAIAAHSPREDVIAATAAAREARADLLVAVGGGSTIDASKAVLLCLWHGLDSPDAMEPYRAGGDRTAAATVRPPADAIRMISVSTTLSAAEFTPYAGITEARTHTKQTFAHRLLAPRVVVLDPAATLATPAWLLSCTGIRSVDHAVESYCSLSANPASEGLSLHGLGLLTRALPAILARPDDLAPRMQAQFGMWQAIAATVSGTGTGASHGIGYVLGSAFGVAHGHTSCVMLAPVLAWNAAVNAERQRALSLAMGLPGEPASTLVRNLVAGLGQPTSLAAVGVGRESFPEIARRAMAYPQVTRQNPRPVRSAADVEEILALAAG
jgi:maleylacetate reductase